MAWGNTDGPEMGSEWHGDDRGTNSRLGCLLAVLLSLPLLILLGYIIW